MIKCDKCLWPCYSCYAHTCNNTMATNLCGYMYVAYGNNTERRERGVSSE